MLPYILPLVIGIAFAVARNEKLLANTKLLYALLFLFIALIGGLRKETGDDYLGYQEYFDGINESLPGTAQYYSGAFHAKFEYGYFLLNYYVKRLGGTCSSVFLVSSLVCAWCTYLFTQNLNGNKFFIFVNYMGFSFILLHFNEVRQSLAVSIFLLGCSYYLYTERRCFALLITLCALWFQFSAIIYCCIFAFCIFIRPGIRVLMMVSFILLGLCLLSLSEKLNPFSLFRVVTPEALSFKIGIYENDVIAPGSGQIVYGLFLIGYISILLSQWITLQTWQARFVVGMTVVFLAATVTAIFMFRANYVMFNRLYVIACIFQGYSGSIIMETMGIFKKRLFFYTTLTVAAVFYVRILILNAPAYFPYQWIFS